MLTVRQLVLLTHNHRRSILEKARSVGVRFDVVAEERDEDGDKMLLVNATCQGDTIPRHVELHFYGKGQSAKVWASCDCEYWLYHCEVADKRKGNTDVIFSNGRRPKITNPNMIAHLCKHIVACLIKGAADAKPRKRLKK